MNDSPLPQELLDEILDEAGSPGSPIGSDLGIPSGTMATDDSAGSVLASTGIQLAGLLQLAAIFLAAGLVFLWAARRDRPTLA